MAQTTQKKPVVDEDSKSKSSDILKPLKDFFAKLTLKERIAYPLIVVGVVLIIIGVVLW